MSRVQLALEVESAEAVTVTQRRLAGQGLVTASEEQVHCCDALQDRVWVNDPDGAPWEVYTVLADVEQTPPCRCETGSDGEPEGDETLTFPLRTVEPSTSTHCC